MITKCVELSVQFIYFVELGGLYFFLVHSRKVLKVYNKYLLALSVINLLFSIIYRNLV
jgi:hypothetical protein